MQNDMVHLDYTSTPNHNVILLKLFTFQLGVFMYHMYLEP